MISSLAETFLSSINNLVPKQSKGLKENGYQLKINIQVDYPNELGLTLSTDESYSLVTSIHSDHEVVQVDIKAKTYFGARHGFETLSQLIAWDDVFSSLIIASDVQIENDQPSFQYRGVMLDLSRHFLPIEVIERTIRSMSYNKMNVLHLHLSDTASFPLEVTNQPN